LPGDGERKVGFGQDLAFHVPGRIAQAHQDQIVAFPKEVEQAVNPAVGPAAQIRLGRADAMIDAAELVIRKAGRDNVAAGALAGAEQLGERIRCRAQIAYAVSLCREAVACLGEAAGSSAQMLDQPFQRAVRDINTIATHVVFDVDMAYELHGRSLIGLPPNAMLV